LGSTQPRLGSTENWLRAQEGRDFHNSSIFEGKAFGTKYLFRWIKSGTFQMGSTRRTDPDGDSNETQHKVTLTRGFWLLDHELTQGEYRFVMGENPSEHTGDWQPVERVSWDEAVEFCRRLTEMDRKKGRISAQQEYRLPTEAEWEYAARAGTVGARYTWGDKNVAVSLDLIAWYSGNSGGHPHVVMEKFPNAWGLYDMLGNVYEWCSDWYGVTPTESVTDPTGPGSGSNRVYRGGSWYGDARTARSAFRHWYDPGFRSSVLGFRPALSSVR